MFDLDTTCLIPSALPPHKNPDMVIDAADRMEMLRIAVSNSPDFFVSDVEIKRAGPSYSIDTVQHFQSVSPKGTAIFLILGMDAFLEIHLWRSFREFFQRVPFIVMTRPGRDAAGAGNTVEQIGNYLKTAVSEKYTWYEPENRFTHPEKADIRIASVTQMDISSTRIRALIRENRSIRFLVPGKVEEFIINKGLFK